MRQPEVIDGDAARLADVLRSARRAVVFTGAGISTESGIPDFRSPGGIWTRMAPIDFQDFTASAEMRKEAWRRLATGLPAGLIEAMSVEHPLEDVPQLAEEIVEGKTRGRVLIAINP